jgi:diguanylate cyclase (GGDEF)-like protein
MNTVSYPLIVMASITLYVGANHLFLYLNRRDAREHLPFSLLCLSVVVYDIFCIGLYNSQSVSQGIIWQGLQLKTVSFISIFIMWFVGIFTGQKKNRVIPIAFVWFVALLVLSLVLNGQLTLTPLKPSIKNVSALGILHATYYEGELGLFYVGGMLSAIVLYMYLLFLLFRHFLKSRDRSSLVILAGLVSYFLGVANDTAVAAHVYSFVYLSEYAFLVVILAGSYALLIELLSLYKSAEDTRQNLEMKVRERTGDIQELNKELKHQAERDGLTGIYNRRFFDQYLEIEVRRARNRIEHRTAVVEPDQDVNFGLAIVDVDEFKRINDTMGHLFGDRALVEVVEEIRKHIFSRDVFCRYGGDEFVILFTRTSREGILRAVEKIRRSVEQHEFRLKAESPPHRVTISMGVVIFGDVPATSSDELLGLADDRLLAAKRKGRNKAVYA